MYSGEIDAELLPSNFLYVLCPERQAAFVRQALARHSHLRWEQQRRIFLWVVPSSRCRDVSYVTSRINQFASRINGYLSVIALAPVRFDETKLRGEVGLRNIAGGEAAFTKRFLPKYLSPKIR
jgi:hypothetical protein